MLEDVFALLKRQTKLKSKDYSMTSAAVDIFNKLWEHNTRKRRLNKSGYFFQTLYHKQSCDVKIKFIENEHLAHHNDDDWYKHLNKKTSKSNRLDVTETWCQPHIQHRAQETVLPYICSCQASLGPEMHSRNRWSKSTCLHIFVVVLVLAGIKLVFLHSC